MGNAYHDGKAFIVDAVVVDWRLKEMGVLFEPLQRDEHSCHFLKSTLCLLGFDSPLGQVHWRAEQHLFPSLRFFKIA